MGRQVGRSDQVEYGQQQFQEQHAKAVARSSQLKKEATGRRTLAYVVKATVALGGLAITAGLSDSAAQIVGIMIAGGVILDSQVFSNHNRLLSLATAETALQALVAGVEHQHRLGLVKILELREQGNDSEARRQLVDMLTTLMRQLYEGQKSIDESLARTDIEALRLLAVKDYKSDAHR